ncbi:hypothetical protein TNCV_2771661 [Trichonephila clavipes]|nr:hypothetical protein TNCV_2771661 [Trichonephila clavipes]
MGPKRDTKLKLDDRGRLFREGWEKKIDHDEDYTNQENSHKKRGGRTYPKARNALTKQSAGGPKRDCRGSRFS